MANTLHPACIKLIIETEYFERNIFGGLLKHFDAILGAQLLLRQTYNVAMVVAVACCAWRFSRTAFHSKLGAHNLHNVDGTRGLGVHTGQHRRSGGQGAWMWPQLYLGAR